MGNHGASKCMSNVPSAARNWWLVWASERLPYSAALQNAGLGIVFDFTMPIHSLQNKGMDASIQYIHTYFIFQ